MCLNLVHRGEVQAGVLDFLKVLHSADSEMSSTVRNDPRQRYALVGDADGANLSGFLCIEEGSVLVQTSTRPSHRIVNKEEIDIV
jgi:hypothetical protein